MTDSLCQFFSWAVRDMIFFSGDVQTTTIAVAITSSLCCSIVVAIVHVVALILPSGQQRGKTSWRHSRAGSPGSLSTKKADSTLWLSSGRVHVPCVKCGKFFADDGCRFVTCQSCCFSVLLCHVHQKKSLPSKPCDIKQTEIDLSDVGMQSCPERLGFVGAQLTCLNLANNQLSDLPPEIGCLRGLQRLCLKQNQLSTLPVTLGSLTRLQSFDISHNQIHTWPDCVTSLCELEELQISHNQISQLKPDICLLKKLTFLDISFNRLKSLCEELFSMIRLEYVSLNSNQLGSIPCAIGNLVKLHTLDLRNCGLTALPHTIGKCSSLHYLSLDDNQLQQLPCQLGQLCQLQLLSLGNNQLWYLPASLSLLLDAVTVHVQGNPFIHKEDYSKYTQYPVQTNHWFPSLKELTSREIIKQNIANTETLPSILQDMLRKVGFCSYCGGPMFDIYSSKIIPYQFMFGAASCIPLYQVLCSPHPLGRCR